MPSVSMTVPYMRTTLLHVPRRDLVLASADSLYLRITVVDSDRACAQAIELSGGIGGPGAQMAVWVDSHGQWCHDYGANPPARGYPLWTGTGLLGDALGSFDFVFPSGTMANWPRRCGWSVQLTYDTTGAEVLAAGALHVRKLGAPFNFAAPVLTTDDYIPVHTDIEEQVFG